MENIPLDQSDIQTAQQSATRSDLEKEYAEFIDMAAHDLDAPLRKLLLLVNMLTDKLSADQEVQSYIGRIKNCVGDMRSLIDDLSILGRITPKNSSFTSCNVDSLIAQALEELPNGVKEKKASINTATLPRIEGDAAMYKCLFKNLLDNAIKFSGANKQPEICIRAAVLTPEEKEHFDLPADRLYYLFEFADNGPGFKKEYAEKIFRPFVRLHGKSQFPGNGMGLAICKKIVDVHNGIIYAESRENEGARFILVLPEIP